MTSHEAYERQKKYDQKHHRSRIRWLESLPKLSHFQHTLLKQSKYIIENPVHGYNSVDLDDTEYLAELDKQFPDKENNNA